MRFTLAIVLGALTLASTAAAEEKVAPPEFHALQVTTAPSTSLFLATVPSVVAKPATLGGLPDRLKDRHIAFGVAKVVDAQKQALNPKATVYVCAKPDDVRAARAAGLLAIGVSHGDAAAEKRLRDVGASLVITKIDQDTLSPVLRFVDKVGARAVFVARDAG